MGKSFVVTSRVREMVKKNKFRAGGEFLETLSERVEEMVTKSIEACGEAKPARVTLKSEDLPELQTTEVD